MEAEKANYSISRMARLLEVSRSGFYRWRARQTGDPLPSQIRRAQVDQLIIKSHRESGGTYGSPRIQADLVEWGERVGVNTVAHRMAILEIQGISPRTWHPATTIPGPDPFPVDDLVSRVFDRGRRDAVWFSDITYLDTGQGWAYCCVVRDGHTRRVLGVAVEDHMETSLVEQALDQAIRVRGGVPHKLIFHADRGCQYTSKAMAKKARKLGILRSMGRTGVCWDNAQAEAFWSILKNEYYHRHVFCTVEQARIGVTTWIHGFYNTRRRNSCINMLAPVEYEKRLALETIESLSLNSR